MLPDRPHLERAHNTYQPPPRPTVRPTRSFGGFFRRHALLLASAVIVAGVLAGVFTMYATPVYEASSMVRLDAQQVNLPQLVQQVSSENLISTEIEVLQRRSAAEPVIDSLGLRAQLIEPRRAAISTYFSRVRVAPDVDTLTVVVRSDAAGRVTATKTGSPRVEVSGHAGDTLQIAGVTLVPRVGANAPNELRLHVSAENQAVRKFESALKVTRPARDADLIAINVRGTDPRQAATAANLLAEQLITNRQQVQLTRTGSTVAFLREQLDTLGPQLRASEDLLQTYRQQAGVVDAAEQARTQVGRLAQLQADRGGVEAEREALASLLQQMRADTLGAAVDSARARRLIAFPTLFRNPAASELLGALARVENERSALLTRRTLEDPDVQALTARIHAIDAQLQGIAETYLQGLTNQVTSMANVARQFGTALDSLPQKEVQTARLEREVRVRQELYTLIQTRLKEAEITEAMKDPSIRIVDRAVAPDKPTWPNPLINFAVAPIIGLLLAIAIGVARDSTDHSVRSRSDAMVASGLPIIGAIPRLRHSRRGLRRFAESERRRLAHGGSTSSTNERLPALPPAGRAATGIISLLTTRADAPAGFVEAFNQLHANLALGHGDRAHKVLVVTSPLAGEGKTLTAVNYALTLAGQGLRVLLIDADLRCGLVNEIFGLPRGPGVAELLSESATFEQAARHVAVGNSGVLTVLPSGARPAAPGRVLLVDRVRDLLRHASPQFDFVIIDSPPVNLLADAALLGAASDAVLLVVRAGRTRIEEVQYAVDQLNAANAPLIGTLLNDIDPRRRDDDESYRYFADVERYADAGSTVAAL